MDEGCLVGLGWMVAMDGWMGGWVDGWMGGWMMDEVSSVDEVCSNFFFHYNISMLEPTAHEAKYLINNNCCPWR